MMRKKFEPALKAKVALEALRGEKTLAQVSRKNNNKGSDSKTKN